MCIIFSPVFNSHVMPTKCIEGALALPSWRWWAERRGGFFICVWEKGGRIESQGVQRSESGGPWNSERRRRCWKRDSIPPPSKKTWKNCAPSMRAACQSEDGDYFYPFIHVSFFPPPSLKQASRSVNVLRALGPVKPVGSWSRETAEDNACFGWEESKWCATADRRPFPKPGLLFFLITSQVFMKLWEWRCFSSSLVLFLSYCSFNSQRMLKDSRIYNPCVFYWIRIALRTD